jgi:hypothetical protein
MSTPRVWYTNHRGYLIKSTLLPNNRIIEERILLQRPYPFLHFANNYFKKNDIYK